MKILVNVATSEKGLVLYNEDQIIDGVFWDQSGQELKWVLPSFHRLVETHALQLDKDIQKIILVIGPGSFTGIRIAVSVVNTLKYLYPQIMISTLSTGQVFSALDMESHDNYFFQVFASDIFSFNRQGQYVGKYTFDDINISNVSSGAGYLMDALAQQYKSFETLLPMPQWSHLDLCHIEKKALDIVDLAEPFYGKGANITVPRS